MTRKFIYKGVEVYQRKKAASVCGLFVAEMIELLAKGGVHANITLEHYREGTKNLEKPSGNRFCLRHASFLWTLANFVQGKSHGQIIQALGRG